MKRTIPLLISLIIFWISTAALFNLSCNKNDGHFIYVLDDPYIHLTLARNLISSGTFGIRAGEFSATSSSPFWTLLISFIFSFTGVNVYVPFILNIIFASLIIIILWYIFDKNKFSIIRNTFWLLSVIFAVPLIPLCFTGMEHLFHSLLYLLFFLWVCSDLTKDDNNSNEPTYPINKGEYYKQIRHAFSFYILVVILSSTRYESLFMIIFCSILYFIKKRYTKSYLILFFGALPVVAFGIFSLNNGGMFFPNSILLKGSFPHVITLKEIIIKFIYLPLYNLFISPHILVLLIFIIINLLIKAKVQPVLKNKFSVGFLILLFVNLIHILFCQFGWFFRYESYLLLTGIAFFALYLKEINLNELYRMYCSSKFSKLIMFVLLLLLSSPFLYRGMLAIQKTPTSSGNIYQQQFQITKFIKTYYNTSNVALNDIGMITFMTNANILDIWGLADIPSLKAKLADNYNTEFIGKRLKEKDIEIAIVFDFWFSGKRKFPSDWLKVAQWSIPDNYICASDNVSFYARDTIAAIRMVVNLRKFSNQLNKNVKETLLFTNISDSK
ncbi:MAG: hypothetical protein HW421_2695 [Ignavibacteria bacterium]|nr:hypothetical protein [Ignavibacteria bacterium]